MSGVGIEACGGSGKSWFTANTGQWFVGSCSQFYSLPVFAISDLRLWSEARQSDSVRGSMYKALPSQQAGGEDEATLVGSWRLNDAVRESRAS